MSQLLRSLNLQWLVGQVDEYGPVFKLKQVLSRTVCCETRRFHANSPLVFCPQKMFHLTGTIKQKVIQTRWAVIPSAVSRIVCLRSMLHFHEIITHLKWIRMSFGSPGSRVRGKKMLKSWSERPGRRGGRTWKITGAQAALVTCNQLTLSEQTYLGTTTLSTHTTEPST